jgi:hypothetical protein
MGATRNYYRIIFRKYEGKRPLERRRNKQDNNYNDNIILQWILKEIGCEDVDPIHLAQNRVQWWPAMNTNEPSGSIRG